MFAGAVKVTVDCALSEVAETEVGAPGTVAGVTELLALEATPVPTVLVAVTVNVYAVPLLKPVTVIGEVVPVAVMLEGDEVTV